MIMSKERALISVVVPVYNQEKYLEKCLLSILGQTYTNLEILIVDDASTDKSAQIIDQYARQDQRIRVKRNPENRGLSYTRNAGIDEAKGGYIGFVDSDDDIEPTFFETLYTLIQDNEADIAGCRYNVLKGYEDKKSIRDVTLPDAEIISTEEAAKRLLLKNGCSDAVWDKLYTASLFQETRMIEGMLYEDQEVVLRLFAQANKIALTNKKLYNYYRRPDSGSITQRGFTEKRHDLLTARSYMHKTVKKAFPELEQLARNRYFEAALKYLYDSRLLPEHDRIRKETKTEINAFVRNYGGMRQRPDILLCLIAMKTNMKLFDFLFDLRGKLFH